MGKHFGELAKIRGLITYKLSPHEQRAYAGAISNGLPNIFRRFRESVFKVAPQLTVPWETNIPKDHTIKLNKYYDLTNKLTKNGYVVNLYAVEVGVRGIPAKSLYNLLKDLGLSRTAVSSILERASKAALAAFIIGYLIYEGVEREHHRLSRKNPADFENDQ